MIKRLIYVLICITLFLFTFRIVLIYFWPFTAGALLACVIYPFIKILFDYVKLPYKLSVLIGLFVLILTGPLILTGCFILLKNEILFLLTRLPGYTSALLVLFQNTVQTFPAFLHDFTHPYLTHSHLSMLIKESEHLLINTGKQLISETSAFAGNLPSVLFSLGMMLIAAYYILSDFKSWRNSVPSGLLTQFDHIRVLGFREAGAYFLAQLLLSLLTFIITLTGLLILGTPHPFLFAVLSAVLDFVPLAGSLLLFLPMTIFYMIYEGPVYAAGAAIIYLLIIGVRQITEPKIIGDRMGLHPLAALVVLYTSVNLLGIKGLLLTPFFLITLAVLMKVRLLHGIWRYIAKGENPLNKP